MVVPNGLQGEVFENIGDYFTYCVSTGTEKIFGELKYQPNTCQAKFKMRAVASFNKIPGFPKISGYRQMTLIGPQIIVS